ncbi:MAG: hypothetical protein ABGW69_03505 [Nanoarchaeota archaeon]
MKSIKLFCKRYKYFCLYKIVFIISLFLLTTLVIILKIGRERIFWIGIIYFLMFIVNFLLLPIIIEIESKRLKRRKEKPNKKSKLD